MFFFKFFFILSLLHLPLYTFPDLKPPNTNNVSLDLNEKKKEKKLYFFVFFVLLFFFRRCLYVVVSETVDF